MARLIGWFCVATFAAWSAAAFLVSGADAGGPLLLSALVLGLGYKAAPALRAEIGRGRNFERTSARSGHPFGAHLHGSEFFRET